MLLNYFKYESQEELMGALSRMNKYRKYMILVYLKSLIAAFCLEPLNKASL